MEKQNTRNNGWLTYSNILMWVPILAGLLLPLLIYSFYDVHFIVNVSKDTGELIMMLVGFLYYSIPFIAVMFITRRDILRKLPFALAIKKWLIKFVPSFMLYLILLIDVARSASKKLPGASTASIVLMIFPIMGLLLVFIGDCFLRRED